MNKQEYEELRASIDAMQKALNNGGTIKLKPASWWFSLLSIITGILIGVISKDLHVTSKINTLQHQIEAKMTDRWSGMMMSVYNQNLAKDNPTLIVPDVDSIKRNVPLPK